MGSLPVLSILKGHTYPLAAENEPILLHRILENTIRFLERNNNNEKIETVHSINLTDTIPQEVALLCGSNRTTFTELNEAANKLARGMLNKIRSSNASRNKDGDYIVAVCFRPSDSLVITLLAIMKTGAAYLPLDVSFPTSRIQHILGESEAVLVVTGEDDVQNYQGFNSIKYQTLREQSQDLPSENLAPAETLTGETQPRTDLAIVLYTSGSSGVPKGVRLPHAVVLNRLKWMFRNFPYSRTENICVFKTALTFVDSVSEIWGPLMYGRSLLILAKEDSKNPERLVQLLEEHNIERFILVPTLLRTVLMYLNMMSDAGTKGNEAVITSKHLKRLRLWITSGEPLLGSLARMFYQYFDSSTHSLCNFYGSTEVMGDVTYCIVENSENLVSEEKVPIGRPIDNTIIYLMDRNLSPVNVGEMGEILVSGFNLAAGYVRGRDPEKFIDNPLAVDPSHLRLYRTGDYARVAKNTVYYEGRIDSQVKIRGHRVDLSEVEATVSKVREVDKCTVLVYNAGEVDQALLTFVTTRGVGTASGIEDTLQTMLAPYMVPQVIVVNSIPLLVNGKVDRQTLLQKYRDEHKPGINKESLDFSGISPSMMPAAKALFETVASVLGNTLRGQINPSCNFYHLGGNSLNSIYAVTKLRDLGFIISITDFISAPTLLDIVQKMKEEVVGVDNAVVQSIYKVEENKFKMELLRHEHKEDVFVVISQSFWERGDLEMFLVPKVPLDDYIDLMSVLWDSLVEKKLSFVARGADGEIKGAALNFDAHDEPDVSIKETNLLNTIFEYLEFLEAPVRENKLPKGKGKVLHSFMLGAKTTLNTQDTIEIIIFLEQEVMKLAKKRGFVGVFTTNTNALTQQLGTDIHEYQVMLDYQANKYVAPNGKKPFGDAPDSLRTVVSWKALQ